MIKCMVFLRDLQKKMGWYHRTISDYLAIKNVINLGWKYSAPNTLTVFSGFCNFYDSSYPILWSREF